MWMPPQLEPWARTLDLSRLPDATAMQARTLLSRADALAPAARTDLARRLAAEVGAYLTPARPAGLDDETFLRTVLTERMRRAAAPARAAGPGRAPAAVPVAPGPPVAPVAPVTPPASPGPDGGFVVPS
jgi:hypothetical protein